MKSDRDAPSLGLTYLDAGVDIEEGNSFVERTIGPLVARTCDAASLQGAGDKTLSGFSATFDPKEAGFNDPIIEMACDGVGTKLRLAIDAQRYEGVGIDLVAMCVNDLLTRGARPLMFLDYLAYADLPEGAQEKVQEKVMESIAAGCEQAGCMLAGGETAQMPSFYAPADFDLAGFALGAIERDAPFRKSKVRLGDTLFAVPSSGVHANGFSLVRAVLEKNPTLKQDEKFIETLLEPTRIYTKLCTPWIDKGLVSGIAHITGGGVEDNLPRILERGQCVYMDWHAVSRAEVFVRLQEAGGIAEAEMRRVFNCGAGLIVAVPSSKKAEFLKEAGVTGEKVVEVGIVEEANDSDAQPFVKFKDE